MAGDDGDQALLTDMLEAALAVQRFLIGRSRADYGTDDLLRSAVERKVEIIGETARAVSGNFTSGHPEIPWYKIRTTRHILARSYGKIDDDIMWKIATAHIPELILLLRPLIPPTL